MNISFRNRILKIILEPECTIEKVIADRDALMDVIKKQPKKIELSGNHVEEIDTAYFQFILAIKSTANQLGIPMEWIGTSEKIQSICHHYGLNI